MRGALLAAAILSTAAGIAEIYPHKSATPIRYQSAAEASEALRKAQAKRDRKAKRNLRNKP